MLYRELVASKLAKRKDVGDTEAHLLSGGGYEQILRKMYPRGALESGCFRVSSSGENGRRMSFILSTGKWTDFADEIVRSGLFTFVYALEGWEGIARLAGHLELRYDFVVFNGRRPADDVLTRQALKLRKIVAGRYDYFDDDGFYLGTRVRLEDNNGKKEFRLLSYRSRKIGESKEKGVYVLPEGFRIDGSWGDTDPLYIQPGMLSRSEKPVMFCEGEKATDHARSLIGHEYDCMTWGSGSAGSLRKADFTALKKRAVFMWPDKDKPGRSASQKMSKVLPQTKIVPVWDADELGEGDDLADVDPTRIDWVKRLISEATTFSANGSAIHMSDWVYVNTSERFINRTTGIMYTPSAYRRMFLSQSPSADEDFLEMEGTTRVEDTTYWPGQDQIVEEMDETTNASVLKFNRWRDSGVEPSSQEPELFLEHMHRLIPDDVFRNEFLDYLAFIVQNPGEKTSITPLICGNPGVGKSYLLVLMQHVMGVSNVPEITTEELSSNFNTWLDGAQLIFVEEVLAPGRRDITNKLKTLITSPRKNINAKGINLRQIRNRANFVLFSNERTPLVIEPNDRRFFCYWTPMEHMESDYYDALFDDIEDGGASAVRGWLESRDLSSFNPRKRAIMTEDKRKMIEANESTLGVHIRMAMEAKRTPFVDDIVEMYDIYSWVCDLRSVRNFDLSPATVRRHLEKYGCVQLPKPENVEDVSEKWIIRNHSRYIQTVDLGPLEGLIDS